MMLTTLRSPAKKGVLIVAEKDVKMLIKDGAKTTPFNRKGNTYAMDAWVRQPSDSNRGVSSDKKPVFSRPGLST